MSEQQYDKKGLSKEDAKEKEKILWEELRNIREIALKMLQWGVTVIATLQTAIFFFRKDLYERMMAVGKLANGEYIPWDRYLIGTFYLFVVASIFAYLLIMVGNRYRKIRSQLVQTNSFGIEHGDVKKSVRWVVVLLFYVFPLLDIAVRLYIKVHFEFQ